MQTVCPPTTRRLPLRNEHQGGSQGIGFSGQVHCGLPIGLFLSGEGCCSTLYPNPRLVRSRYTTGMGHLAVYHHARGGHDPV